MLPTLMVRGHQVITVPAFQFCRCRLQGQVQILAACAGLTHTVFSDITLAGSSIEQARLSEVTSGDTVSFAISAVTLGEDGPEVEAVAALLDAA